MWRAEILLWILFRLLVQASRDMQSNGYQSRLRGILRLSLDYIRAQYSSMDERKLSLAQADNGVCRHEAILHDQSEQYLGYNSTWGEQLRKEAARSDDSWSEVVSLRVRERKGVVCAEGGSVLR